MSGDQIKQRKLDHLKIVADGGAGFARSTLLECVELTPCALPELDLAAIDTSARFLGKQLALPLMITSMTGGAGIAGQLNRDLATAAAEYGIAFATGSQRVMLTNPESAADFAIRDCIPDGVLLGNLGGQQLLEYTPHQVAGLASAIDADGLCIHLNPAHELAQAEGDRNFSGILDAIRSLNAELEGRVLVKEVGHGISPAVVERLQEAGIKMIDVAGAGGTSWTRVEALRSGDADSLGAAFAEWGIPTAAALAQACGVRGPDTQLVASGGIRSGLDTARAVALGADICGIAQPVLKAYLEGGVQGVKSLVERLARELRAAMLLTASSDLGQLKGCARQITGPLAAWLADSRNMTNR